MRKLTLVKVIFVIASYGVSFGGGFPAVEVYEKTSNSVVLIIANSKGKVGSVGAGSFIVPSGLIVTNAHVVIDRESSDSYSSIRVYTKPEKVTGDFSRDLVKQYEGKIVSFDSALDVAVLRVGNIPENVGVVELANPEDIKIGEEVIAIGHPERGGLWTLTYGRISGEIENQSNIDGKDVYQTDTSVNRGNSGGPLLDMRGYLVGINTNIARLGAGNMPITGVNFAIKSAVVKEWLGKQGIDVHYGKAPLIREESSYEKKNVETTSPAKDDAQLGKDKIEQRKKPEMKNDEYKKVPRSDEILTPLRPYEMGDLFKQVEREMEDMMEEMKEKIRK